MLLRIPHLTMSEEQFSLCWDPVVLMQAGPVETHYTWTGAPIIERVEEQASGPSPRA